MRFSELRCFKIISSIFYFKIIILQKMSLIKCYICKKTQGNFVEVKQKGLISLVKVSQMRDDNKFNNVSGTIMVHIECRNI